MDRSIKGKAGKYLNKKTRNPRRVTNISISINNWNYSKKSHVVEDEYPGPLDHFVFFWVNIGWYTLIFVSNYSDSVSWWTKNNRSMALAPYVVVLGWLLLPAVWPNYEVAEFQPRSGNTQYLGSVSIATS